MKRVINLLLCVVISASMLLIFSSCKKGETKVDLKDYDIVYSSDFSAGLVTEVNQFAKDLGNLIGYDFNRVRDKSKEEIVSDDFEILIGLTKRAESRQALEEIEGDGYCIRVLNNKIVIIGTTNLLTRQAIDLFVSTYCAEGEGMSSEILLKDDLHYNIEMVEVTKSYNVVYSYRLDDTPSTAERYEPGNPNAFDYPVVAAEQIRSKLTQTLGLTASTTVFPIGKDKTSLAMAKEILVGETTREESKGFRATLEANEYGFTITSEGDIVITGTNDMGLREAVSKFSDAILDSTALTGDKKSVRFPLNYTYKAAFNQSWFLDFPRPEGEGIEFVGSVDVYDNSIELCYDGSGVNEASFADYCRVLENAGYCVHMSNRIEDSIFKTYINEAVGATLHVSYAAFKHANAQGVTLFSPCIRIVSSTLDSVNVIEEELLNERQTFEKVTQTRITTMQLNRAEGNWGNCYIMTLEDGSFVIFDGAGSYGNSDHNRLWNVLSTLYEQVHGYLPSAENPIVIAAWYLSHGHFDHFSNFWKFCEVYGSRISVERMLANFSSDEENYNTHDPNPQIRDSLNRLNLIVSGGVKYYKVHSGQKFYIRNVELEVLYTHEDLYPQKLEIFNDSSTVIRFTVHNTDGNGNRSGESCSSLWLGDLHYRGSKCLRAMYGAYLDSDMVQLAHHGYNGCEYELYQLVSPELVWWPCGRGEYHNTQTVDPNSSVTQYVIDYRVAHELESVRYIILGDDYNTTLTITPNGPDYTIDNSNDGSGTGIYNVAEYDPTNQKTWIKPSTLSSKTSFIRK